MLSSVFIKGVQFAALYFAVDSVSERKNFWIAVCRFLLSERKSVCHLLCKEGKSVLGYISELTYVGTGQELVYSLHGTVLVGSLSDCCKIP